MKNNAFSLFEFIVYVALFSLISVLFLGLISRVQHKFAKNSYNQEILLRQVLATDLLRRDLISAGILISDWDVGKGVFKKIILTKQNNKQELCVSWFIGKNGLMRAQGLYNFEKHEWEKKTSSLVCNSINQVRFVLEKCEFQGLYIGVWVIYKCFGSDLEKKIFVRFRNKVVM